MESLIEKYKQLLKQRFVSRKVAQEFELGLLYKNIVVGDFHYDIPSKFLNRTGIVFPVKDLYNNIVSFYFRKLDKSKLKYDSVSFSKQYILFGLNYTWKYLLESKSCIIVEGPFDFFTLLSFGIKNVCSSLGTTLSFYQVCLLKRFVEKCYIIYDGDVMGRYHSQQVKHVFDEVNLKAESILLPQNFDPDTFLINKGKQQFLQLLSNSYNLK